MNEITNIMKVVLVKENAEEQGQPHSRRRFLLEPTGFSSPAEHYLEAPIDLVQLLIRHPTTTFFMTMGSDAMREQGIFPNATLVVDRTPEARSGHIIVARIGDEFWTRQLLIDEENKMWLVPKNDNYQPFEVTEDLDFEIWGKVIRSINLH